MLNQHQTAYLELLERFVQQQITAPHFETAFLQLHRTDTHPYSEEAATALSVLFTDVDAYCQWPELRTERDIDETQLRESASLALAALKRYWL